MLNLFYAYVCFPYKKENSLRAGTMFYSHLYHNFTVSRITYMSSSMTIDLITLTATPGKMSKTRYWDLHSLFRFRVRAF